MTATTTSFERQIEDLRTGDFAELQALIEDVDKYYSGLAATVGCGSVTLESTHKWARAALRRQVDDALRQRADASQLRVVFETAHTASEQDLLAAAADGLVVHGVPSTISGPVFDGVELASRLADEALSPEFRSLMLPTLADHGPSRDRWSSWPVTARGRWVIANSRSTATTAGRGRRRHTR